MTAGEWFRRMPWSIVIVVGLLMTAGMLGIARGEELIRPSQRLVRQAVWIGLSVGVMITVTLIPYRSLRPWSYGLFLLSLGALVFVFFMPYRNGARRWIPLGLMDFQPSEVAKLTYIMALAHYLMYRQNFRQMTGLMPPFLITMIPVALILKEPDLGTSLLFIPVLYAMLFVAGAKARHLIAVTLLGVCCLPILWSGMSAEQKSRIVTLFTQQDGGPAPSGDGYHLHQSKQVLALGGIWGSSVTGQTVNDPAAYRIPAAQTDFVFCLIGECWGFVGCGIILLLYAFLFARCLMVARATQEPFGRLLVVGVVTLLASQTAINTGMTVGLMPITGMTLPLMSYGGSSMISTCLALGLLLNVAIRPGYEIQTAAFRFQDPPKHRSEAALPTQAWNEQKYRPSA